MKDFELGDFLAAGVIIFCECERKEEQECQVIMIVKYKFTPHTSNDDDEGKRDIDG